MECVELAPAFAQKLPPVEATLERIPYAPHEVATQRAYVLARKPSP